MSRIKKKKKIPWQQYVANAFMMLMGGFCGFVMVAYIDNMGADTLLHKGILSLVVLFLGIYVAFFFHTIVHEAGHLVFGLMTGYQFSSFRVFSFMWLRENGRLKFKRLSLAGTSGQCLMLPPDIKNGKLPQALYNLGGSLFNMIVGGLFLIGHLLVHETSFLSPLFVIFAFIGFLIALLNGIPMRMGTVDNDGYNAFALRKSAEATEAFWVQLKVAEQSSKGVRIKDMPAEWFSVPKDEAMKNSMVATRGVFACSRLMDEGRFKEADSLMEHLLEIDSGIVGLHRSLMICDRVFIELIGENRREIIENMLTKEQRKFMKVMKRYPSVLRTEYVIALLFDHNSAKANTVRNEFEKAAKSYPYPHEVDSERLLMDAVNEKYSSEKNSPVS